MWRVLSRCCTPPGGGSRPWYPAGIGGFLCSTPMHIIPHGEPGGPAAVPQTTRQPPPSARANEVFYCGEEGMDPSTGTIDRREGQVGVPSPQRRSSETVLRDRARGTAVGGMDMGISGMPSSPPGGVNPIQRSSLRRPLHLKTRRAEISRKHRPPARRWRIPAGGALTQARQEGEIVARRPKEGNSVVPRNRPGSTSYPFFPSRKYL